MNLLALLAYFGGTIVTVTLFYSVAARRSRPIYESASGVKSERIDSKSIFKSAASVSAVVGIVLSLIHSFSLNGIDLLGFTTVTLTTMVTFILVVSFYTDHAYRMADRVLLHWGLGMALVLGTLRLIEIQSESTTVLYIVSILIGLSVMFAPNLGASDSRAFMLLFAVSIPVIGVLYSYYVFLVSIALWLGYGIVSAIVTRNFKVSIPLVPYILLPTALAPIVISIVYGVPRIIEVIG